MVEFIAGIMLGIAAAVSVAGYQRRRVLESAGFQIIPDPANVKRWTWQLVARNYRIVAVAGQSFESPSASRKAASTVHDYMRSQV